MPPALDSQLGDRPGFEDEFASVVLGGDGASWGAPFLCSPYLVESLSLEGCLPVYHQSRKSLWCGCVARRSHQEIAHSSRDAPQGGVFELSAPFFTSNVLEPLDRNRGSSFVRTFLPREEPARKKQKSTRGALGSIQFSPTPVVCYECIDIGNFCCYAPPVGPMNSRLWGWGLGILAPCFVLCPGIIYPCRYWTNCISSTRQKKSHPFVYSCIGAVSEVADVVACNCSCSFSEETKQEVHQQEAHYQLTVPNRHLWIFFYNVLRKRFATYSSYPYK